MYQVLTDLFIVCKRYGQLIQLPWETLFQANDAASLLYLFWKIFYSSESSAKFCTCFLAKSKWVELNISQLLSRLSQGICRSPDHYHCGTNYLLYAYNAYRWHSYERFFYRWCSLFMSVQVHIPSVKPSTVRSRFVHARPHLTAPCIVLTINWPHALLTQTLAEA